MKYKSLKILSALVVSFLLNSPVNATLITVNWEGTISSSSFAAVNDGDSITGSFTYDDTAPVASTGTNFSRYGTNHVSSFSVNGLSGSRDANRIDVFNDSGLGDQFVSSSLSGGTYTGDFFDGLSVVNIFVRFDDSTSSVFSDTNLPSTLDPADFDFVEPSFIDFEDDFSSLLFNVDTFTVETSAVPVPAAVWLMGSALAGLFGFQRKKVG